MIGAFGRHLGPAHFTLCNCIWQFVCLLMWWGMLIYVFASYHISSVRNSPFVFLHRFLGKEDFCLQFSHRKAWVGCRKIYLWKTAIMERVEVSISVVSNPVGQYGLSNTSYWTWCRLIWLNDTTLIISRLKLHNCWLVFRLKSPKCSLVIESGENRYNLIPKNILLGIHLVSSNVQ